MAHNDEGEDRDDPQPNTVATRNAPNVVWDPMPDKGGLTFTDTDPSKNKLLVHTTETPPTWTPSYPYPPHLTVNLLDDSRIYQHVTLDKGSYAMKSASPESPNYEAGPTWQIEHTGYAADTPNQGDTWYRNLAREVVWFHLHKDVPLIFAPVWEDGSAYGDWSGRMSQAEFAEFPGICGHQHAPSPNAHWDPGRLDVPRLKAEIDKLLDTTDPDEEAEEMILVEGAKGNAVKSMQRALNNWSSANNKGWSVAVDGSWEVNSALTDRVKEFQKALNLTQSGTVDGLTAGYLVGRYDPPNL